MVEGYQVLGPLGPVVDFSHHDSDFHGHCWCWMACHRTLVVVEDHSVASFVVAVAELGDCSAHEQDVDELQWSDRQYLRFEIHLVR